MTDHYLLDNASVQAEARFAALSDVFDTVTIRHLLGVGLSAGWRCWEVGAGGLGLASQLAEAVGPEGHVVATDIDTTWMTADGGSGPVEVRTHDVAHDPVPGQQFDLVHARLVLVHVPGRDQALRNMVQALRPGGWFLLEDFDPLISPLACLEPGNEDEHRANRIRTGFVELLGQRGADLEYGRKLPRLLREQGLLDVGADAFLTLSHPAARLLEQANTLQVAPGLVAGGYATEAEIEAHIQVLRAGAIDVACPPLVSAWGRRRP